MRPIDIQTIMPKVQSHHNSRETVVNKAANELQSAQLKGMEETNKKMTMINKNEKKEKSRKIKEREKKESNSKRKKKKNLMFSKKEKELEENDLKKESNSKNAIRQKKFDMKI